MMTAYALMLHRNPRSHDPVRSLLPMLAAALAAAATAIAFPAAHLLVPPGVHVIAFEPDPGEDETDLAIVNGSFPCLHKGRLNFSGEGSVTVKAADRADCGFIIKTQSPRSARNVARRGSWGGTPSIPAEEPARRFTSLRTRTSGLTAVAIMSGSIDPELTEIELTVPRSLTDMVIATRSGNLSASGFKGGVWLETGAGSIDADAIGGDLMAKTGGGNIQIGHVAGRLRCASGGGEIRIQSAGGETVCESSGGEIVVDEVKGVLHVTTGGGNIRVGRAHSMVMAESISGMIEVVEAAGLVTAKTRGGMIEVGSAHGCTCEAGAGGIRVRTLDGPLMLHAGGGHIQAELLSGTFRSDSILRSASGDITILIPSNLAVTVQAKNITRGFGGRIVSEFPAIRVNASPATVLAEGSLNGGGPVLQIVAQGGNIYLRRQR